MTTSSGHTSAIAASRVIGTDVFNTAGDKIGTVADVMLDKLSNNIMFAVVGFGGFLGVGEKYHAIPWSALDYEKDKDGYIVPYSREHLEAGPAHSVEDLSKDDGKAARDESYDYYKVDPYWS